MLKAVSDAFKKVSSIEAYRKRYILTDDFASIIRHEYEVPDDKKLDKSILNNAMSRDGCCSTEDLCSANATGVYQYKSRPDFLLNGERNTSHLKCYYITDAGTRPPNDNNWYGKVQQVQIGPERLSKISKEE